MSPGLVLVVVALTSGWAAGQPVTTEGQRTFEFASSGVIFDADFEGARLNDCRMTDGGEYRVVIRPENEPINDSPWYAFRISADEKETINVLLSYEGGKHRYWPQVSTNGIDWRPLASGNFTAVSGQAGLRVDVGPEPLWVAAQELIGVREMNAWMDKLVEAPVVREALIGESVGGRPLRQLSIAEGSPDHAVFIVGRQHPPEVTGSIALMRFVETIAGPGELAREFRQRFETAVVPLANPDGVASGHWRHNLNGVDLNRDWGPFSQPETRAMRDAVLRYQSDETPRLAFFLDFHSTFHDVFYLEPADEGLWPAGFARRWLAAVSARMPDYTFRTEANPPTKPYSKTWVRKTLEVPAVIYETGDHTDRTLVRQVATVAAEEMMRLLLQEVGR